MESNHQYQRMLEEAETYVQEIGGMIESYQRGMQDFRDNIKSDKADLEREQKRAKTGASETEVKLEQLRSGKLRFSEMLYSDRNKMDYLLAAIEFDPSQFRHATQRLRADPDAAEAIMKDNPQCWYHISGMEKYRKEYIMKAAPVAKDIVQFVRRLPSHAKKSMLSDKDFIRIVMSRDHEQRCALRFPDSILKDVEFLESVGFLRVVMLDRLPDYEKREYMKRVLSRRPDITSTDFIEVQGVVVPDTFRNDDEIMYLFMTRLSPYYYLSMSKRLKTTKRFIMIIASSEQVTALLNRYVYYVMRYKTDVDVLKALLLGVSKGDLKTIPEVLYGIIFEAEIGLDFSFVDVPFLVQLFKEAHEDACRRKASKSTVGYWVKLVYKRFMDKIQPSFELDRTIALYFPWVFAPTDEYRRMLLRQQKRPIGKNEYIQYLSLQKVAKIQEEDGNFGQMTKHEISKAYFAYCTFWYKYKKAVERLYHPLNKVVMDHQFNNDE